MGQILHLLWMAFLLGIVVILCGFFVIMVRNALGSMGRNSHDRARGDWDQGDGGGG